MSDEPEREPEPEPEAEPGTEPIDEPMPSLEDLAGGAESFDPDAADLEPTKGTVGRAIDRLRSTEPHMPLDEVSLALDPENGGPNRIARGLQKIAGVNATEAWMDIAMGVIETVMADVDGGDDGDDGTDRVRVSDI